LIGEDELRQMPRHALLINTSRGGIVDDCALARALTEGWIAGAGIDVLAEEPPRRGNPLLDLRLPNLIVTPHVAWASTGSLAALAEQVIANMECFVRGEPRHVVVNGRLSAQASSSPR
jgi:glycerate dehydrogenase